MKDKPCFRASLNSAGEFEILIYEEIGYDWWSGTGITAKAIRDSLDRAGTYSKIVVRINSPGGDAFEGVAIGNVLKSTGKPIDVYVDGIAASSASIVAMCGGTIAMANNAMMMIHNAWTIAMGDASDLRKMADTLEKISQSIAQTYVDRSGKTMEEITAMMDAETWLSAEDCLANGFATLIVREINQPAMAMAKRFKSLAKLKHVPEKLKADAKPDECGCDCEACADDDCANCSQKDCEDANCIDCPMQQEAGNRSNLSLYQAQQWETEKGIRA